MCTREATNATDRYMYAIPVMNEETNIGRSSRKISKVCSVFLRRGGFRTLEVLCAVQYSDKRRALLVAKVSRCKIIFEKNFHKVICVRKYFYIKKVNNGIFFSSS